VSAVQPNTAEGLFGDEWPALLKRLSSTVADSFKKSARPMRNQTRFEMLRRTDYVLKRACELRADMGWSSERIGDQMADVLRCFIDGVAWEPDTRSSWVDTTDTAYAKAS
jgi:hypothetical protein